METHRVVSSTLLGDFNYFDLGNIFFYSEADKQWIMFVHFVEHSLMLHVLEELQNVFPVTCFISENQCYVHRQLPTEIDSNKWFWFEHWWDLVLNYMCMMLDFKFGKENRYINWYLLR